MAPQIYRQGDVLLVALHDAPAGTKPVPRDRRGLVLAEGEVTGHAHTIDAPDAELVTADQAVELYLLVHGTDLVELTHQEHSTILVPPGAYEVRRQREYHPEEIRTVAD